MTHLLQYFPQLSLRPENLPELRSLILQLAVEGKLTAEWRKVNLDVEPASELLARIEAEKAALVKAKQIKKSKPLPPVRAEEMPFELPEGWVWCRLGEIGIINPRNDADESILAGFIPMKNISEEYGVEPIPEKRAWGEIKKGYTHFQDDDVAFAKITPCFQNSKAALFSNLPNGIGAGTTELHVFRPFIQNSYSKFVYNIFKAPRFLSEGEKVMTGSAGQKRVPKDYFKNYIIALPPLPEQQAIVQTVDALLQELDQLQQRTETRLQLKTDYATAALRRLTTAPAVGPAWDAMAPHFRTFFDETGNVQSLRAAILQLAVQGKLTAQWRKAQPGVEPATELLSRIQAEKAALVKAKKIKKEKPLPPVDMDEVPFGVPEGWVWCRLGQVITFLNGFAFKSSTYVADSEYQIIRLGNVKNDGLKLDIKQAYVPKEIGESTLAYQILENDILTTLTGTKGKKDYCYTCIVEAENVENKTLLLNQRVGCIRAVERSFPPLLNIFLKSESLLDQLFATESGTANQGNIGSGSFKQLIFPLPPLPEQHAIVQAVEELLGLCTALEEAAGRRDVVLGDWVRAVVAGV